MKSLKNKRKKIASIKIDNLTDSPLTDSIWRTITVSALASGSDEVTFEWATFQKIFFDVDSTELIKSLQYLDDRNIVLFKINRDAEIIFTIQKDHPDFTDHWELSINCISSIEYST